MQNTLVKPGTCAMHAESIFELLNFIGDLQNTVIAMSDCAYKASIALAAYSRVSRSHTTLTSECGSMLEEVS